METEIGGLIKLGRQCKQVSMTSAAKLATTVTTVPVLCSLRKKNEPKEGKLSEACLLTKVFLVYFLDPILPLQKMAYNSVRLNKSRFRRRI